MSHGPLVIEIIKHNSKLEGIIVLLILKEEIKYGSEFSDEEEHNLSASICCCYTLIACNALISGMLC